MRDKIQVFENAEFGKLEVLMIANKPYFPATECARIIGHKNPERAIREFCKGVTEIVTPSTGGNQKCNFIPEGDLYRLIIRSKLPAAERFETWVFDDVLPSVRKFGAYITSDTIKQMQDDPNFTSDLLKELTAEQAKNRTLTEYVDILQPKARYYDAVLQCAHALPVSLIAKDYGMTAQRFNILLHTLRIQYKIRDAWVLYKAFANKGYTVSRTHLVNGELVALHTQWTQAGRRFIYAQLEQYGIFPSTQKASVEQMVMENM